MNGQAVRFGTPYPDLQVFDTRPSARVFISGGLDI
jgi:hypothetical protein